MVRGQLRLMGREQLTLVGKEEQHRLVDRGQHRLVGMEQHKMDAKTVREQRVRVMTREREGRKSGRGSLNRYPLCV